MIPTIIKTIPRPSGMNIFHMLVTMYFLMGCTINVKSLRSDKVNAKKRGKEKKNKEKSKPLDIV